MAFRQGAQRLFAATGSKSKGRGPEGSAGELRGLMSDRGKLAEANAKLDAVRKALRTKR